MKPLVDNFAEFRKHLDFSKENTFYFCQLIQRSKDPFDRRKWSEELDQTIGEVKSDNPITLLYYHGLSGKSK